MDEQESSYMRGPSSPFTIIYKVVQYYKINMFAVRDLLKYRVERFFVIIRDP